MQNNVQMTQCEIVGDRFEFYAGIVLIALDTESFAIVLEFFSTVLLLDT